MKIHVITLFPEMFESPLQGGMIGRAIEQGLIVLKTHALREFGLGNYRQVDDAPYGGGSGMVMRPEPIAAAIDAVDAECPGLWRVLMTPQGEVFDQAIAREFAGRTPGLMLIAGRYEGIDERVRALVDQEISIGDYVLSGGELPAMVVIEAVGRLLPGVLGNPESLDEESFAAGMLEYPQYTRPDEFRGMRVPDVLLSGDHGKIREWRAAESRRRTTRRRPDLLERRRS
ncbi:MAG: tRNA (guanosine(37)-N1)-methyltransferase TrmD [Candidatus Binatus sp.]|nr:tRNA (guanosine(37)-N1)-methyltransferase TrmD [Candidatus Binatus sp.]MDO8433099.1 tRNA (guanosine(37)-N1)-methyltransferase TrmD [Candidatus Binatus sp.]